MFTRGVHIHNILLYFAVVLYGGQTVVLVGSVLICGILFHNFKTEVREVKNGEWKKLYSKQI